jgi:3'-5' exoribonuclease
MGAIPQIVGGSRHRLRDPRAFCKACFPWPFITDLSDGDEVTACYMVHEKRRASTRHGKPYLNLVLGDRTGTIEAKVWDEPDRWAPICAAEEIIGVRGRVSVYHDKLQLAVQLVEALRVEDRDLEFFLRATPRDREQMERELEALLSSIKALPVRTLLRRCLGRTTRTGKAFRLHPAAKRNHHAYLGGLLEHSLSVAAMCDRLAKHYISQGAKLDRDLLLAGALLHDIGKIREISSTSGFAYTTEGKLLGHIVIGIQLLAREGEVIPDLAPERLLLLQHLIASHQGKPEWDSPKVPQMLEALLLHYADDLDSKMNPAMALMANVSDGEWSEYDRNFGRSFFQPPALPAGGDVEPVAAEEAVELLIDLFRG